MPLTKQKPLLRAVNTNIFPTMGSVDAVVDYAVSKLPIEDKNELVSILMIFQNTLTAQNKEHS